MRSLYVVLLLAMIWDAGCATRALRPCTSGGQAPHEDGKPGKGNKQCEQFKDSTGKFVNHGRYEEWYPNGQRSIEGEYLSGSKHGKWTEWDELGRKTSEKWFENGEEIQGRETQPYNGLTPQPRKAPSPLPATE